MMDVASWFYRIVHDIVLEYLIGRVQKSKKPINNQSARASNEH
jgi:hypothetical protein